MNKRLGLTAGIAIAAAMVMVNNAADVMAQNNAIATGNWSTPTTWSAGVEPTDTLSAAINGSFTVTIDTAGETTNLLDVGSIAGQTGNLSITDGNLFITDPDTVTAPNTPALRLGTVATATGTLTMTGGQVFVGDAAGSGIGNGELLVGDNGNGTMNQSGGIFEAADEIFIGLFGTGVGEINVSGTGSLSALGRSIIVGFAGSTGTLDVSGSGDVNANFDMLVGLGEGGTAEVNLSGGTIDAGFMFSNAFTGGIGNTVTMTQTGGTYTARIAYVLGQGAGTSMLNHSGGLINCPSNNGDFVVSDSFDPGNANTSTYNISGTATVTVLHNFFVGAFNEANGIVNQSGGSITVGDNVFVGRDGDGLWNMSGGSTTATNVFLGDFDNSNGTMNVSGGTLNLSGNLNVGAAIASNADNVARVEPGQTDPQGQALDANGIFNVVGTGGTINVTGNLLANPDDKGTARNDPGEENDSTLRFTLGATGISTIDVGLKADLDGAVIDLNDAAGFFTANPAASLTLIDAIGGFGNVYTLTTNEAAVGPAGAGKNFTLAPGDASMFNLAIIDGVGAQELLVLTKTAGADVDLDDDGDVDGNDLLLIQRGLGTTTNAQSFVDFRNEFGSAVPAVGAVPEPSAVLLLGVGLAALALRRRAKAGPLPSERRGWVRGDCI